jgi:RNA polymerase sigma-70 factor (ECF subfamily)
VTDNFDREKSRRLSSEEEREIVRAWRKGDPAAPRRLVDSYYEPLYRFLWRLTGSKEASADLTQEVFVRALSRVDSFDGRSRFSTWLHAIAINLWKDEQRRALREKSGVTRVEPSGGPIPDCQDQALARLQGDEVRRCVERLPEAQRIATLLFYYEGMSYKEIGQVCGVSVGTVGSWIYHGIRGLRRMLDSQYECAIAAPIAPASAPSSLLGEGLGCPLLGRKAEETG